MSTGSEAQEGGSVPVIDPLIFVRGDGSAEQSVDCMLVIMYFLDGWQERTWEEIRDQVMRAWSKPQFEADEALEALEKMRFITCVGGDRYRVGDAAVEWVSKIPAWVLPPAWNILKPHAPENPGPA